MSSVQRLATAGKLERNAQERDDAQEESDTTEVGESTYCVHCPRVVVHISSWVR